MDLIGAAPREPEGGPARPSSRRPSSSREPAASRASPPGPSRRNARKATYPRPRAQAASGQDRLRRGSRIHLRRRRVPAPVPQPDPGRISGFRSPRPRCTPGPVLHPPPTLVLRRQPEQERRILHRHQSRIWLARPPRCLHHPALQRCPALPHRPDEDPVSLRVLLDRRRRLDCTRAVDLRRQPGDQPPGWIHVPRRVPRISGELCHGAVQRPAPIVPEPEQRAGLHRQRDHAALAEIRAVPGPQLPEPGRLMGRWLRA